MDLKQAGNLLYLVGETRDELGGSHFALVNKSRGGQVPRVDGERARATFAAMHRAIRTGLVRACHDLSEGGLAAAAAEMAFAGSLGAKLDLRAMPTGNVDFDAAARLYSESNTRFLCEIAPDHAADFERVLRDISFGQIGKVTSDARLAIGDGSRELISADIHELKRAWQKTLRF
jgi:phosphoribosylformylglycinamidine synthase